MPLNEARYISRSGDDKAFDAMTNLSANTGVEDAIGGTKKKADTGTIHLALGAAGMAPGVGFIADLLDAGLYGIEGDKIGVGLSLLSAIPVLGLISGSGKLGKAAKIAKAQKQQTSMVEGVQKVIKSFGGDTNDAKLVSELTDEFTKAAHGLVESQNKFKRFYQNLGGTDAVDFEDALSVFQYRESLTPAAKAAQKQYREVVGESAEEIADWKDMMERAFEFMDSHENFYGKGAENWVKWMDDLDFMHESKKVIGKSRS